MGSYVEAFSSSIAGLSDAVGLKSKKDGSGFVAAACRQAQMGVGSFARRTHERLMDSAAWLGLTGSPLWSAWSSKDNDDDHTFEA